MTNHDQMWQKYLPLATFAYNTFNTPNIANYSSYELVFSRKPKVLLNLKTMPDIKVLGTFKFFYNMLNKRLQYLHALLKDFRLSEHERLKPTIIRTSQGNVCNLAQLKKINIRIRLQLTSS